MAVAIGLGMAVAAIAPLWATWILYRARSDTDYRVGLEARLRDTENRLAQAQRDAEALTATIAELRGENIDLMRRLMKAGEV